MFVLSKTNLRINDTNPKNDELFNFRVCSIYSCRRYVCKGCVSTHKIIWWRWGKSGWENMQFIQRCVSPSYQFEDAQELWYVHDSLHTQQGYPLSSYHMVCNSPQSLCSPSLLRFPELSFPDAGPPHYSPFHHLSGSWFMTGYFQSQAEAAEPASCLSPGKTLWPSVQSLRFSSAYHKSQGLRYLLFFWPFFVLLVM